MTEVRTLAEGLRFPEGPIAMNDGSIVLVEIARGTLTRVAADGEVSVVAELGGGPNGAAIGPDGRVYVCNNGGFVWHEHNGRLFPGEQPPDYSGGRIERVDLETGEAEVLYTHCGDVALRGPNDIVFDRSGGFWFTDHGKTRPRERDRTGVFYAHADGSYIEEVIFGLEGPNGIGLSAAEDELYVAETLTGRLWAFTLSSPGCIDASAGMRPHGGRLLADIGGYLLYDSLAVDGNGNVCVATIVQGGISVVPPDGSPAHHVPTDDPLTTNICFGGPGLRTAYVTLSSHGRLVAFEWECAGQPLNFLNL